MTAADIQTSVRGGTISHTRRIAEFVSRLGYEQIPA
jgi:hypothetical protein